MKKPINKWTKGNDAAVNDSDEKYRGELVTTRDDMQASNDTWVLKLAVGALGLSFSFRGNYPTSNNTEKWCLYAAWILWVCAILTVLTSYQLSVWSHQHRIDAIEKKSNRTCEKVDWLLNFTNITSSILFFLGIVSFFILASLRLWFY